MFSNISASTNVNSMEIHITSDLYCKLSSASQESVNGIYKNLYLMRDELFHVLNEE